MCFYVGIGFRGVRYPGLAFGWFHLEPMIGEGADPEGPYMVEEDGVTRDDYVIYIG